MFEFCWSMAVCWIERKSQTASAFHSVSQSVSSLVIWCCMCICANVLRCNFQNVIHMNRTESWIMRCMELMPLFMCTDIQIIHTLTHEGRIYRIKPLTENEKNQKKKKAEHELDHCTRIEKRVNRPTTTQNLNTIQNLCKNHHQSRYSSVYFF